METISEMINAAHQHSSNHIDEIYESNLCGCFYCMEIFSPEKISDWIEDTGGKTALCPCCNIDSVIGSKSNYPITKEFLREMNKKWF